MSAFATGKGTLAPLGSLRRGLQIQMRVIGALLMRELHTRYGRENVGYLWLFLEPLTLASAVAAMHAGHASQYGSDIRMVPLAIVGYCFFIMFRGIAPRAEGALESNMPLLYHRTVTIFDIILARAFLDGAGVFVSFIILMTFAVIAGLANTPERPLEILIGALLMFWFATATALIICGVTHENRLVGRLIHPATYILMPLSGAFFVVSWIPEPYRTWLTWTPMANIFELLRYGQFRSATADYFSIPYILVWCVVLSYAGMVIVRRTRRHIHLQ